MTVLAAGPSVGAGFIAFLVVLGLVAASVLLFRSMLKHLRNVPKSFDDKPRRPGDPPPPAR